MKMLIVIICLFAITGYGQLSSDVISNSRTNNIIVNGKPTVDYSSSRNLTWRFVHNGKSLLNDVFLSGSITYTPNKIVECKTLDLATNEIAKLRLKLTDQQIDSISNLLVQTYPERYTNTPTSDVNYPALKQRGFLLLR